MKFTQDQKTRAAILKDHEKGIEKIARLQAEANGYSWIEKWDFLTGAKSEIVRLAVDEMKLIAREKPKGEQVTPEDLFIHSSYFVVIDQRGRLRGVLESLDDGWKEKAVDLATQLLNEQP